MLENNIEDKENQEVAQDGVTPGSFEEAYYQSIKNLKEGEIIKGKVIAISKRDAVIDIGYKSEGLISLEEFGGSENVNVGDEIDVLLESVEDENGMVVLSKNKAEKIAGWEKILNNYNEGDVIKGKAMRKVKGGVMVDIGVEAFCRLANLH